MAAKDEKGRTDAADVTAALQPDNPPNVEFDAKNELLDNDDLPNAQDLEALKAQGMVLLPSGRLAHESELDPETENVIIPPQSANLERRLALRKQAEAAGLSVGEGLENDARDRHIAALEAEIEALKDRAQYDGPGREDTANTYKRRLQGAQAELAALRGQQKEGDVADSDTRSDEPKDAARTRAAQTSRSAAPQGRTAAKASNTTAQK
jgi:hypothetical protein